MNPSPDVTAASARQLWGCQVKNRLENFIFVIKKPGLCPAFSFLLKPSAQSGTDLLEAFFHNCQPFFQYIIFDGDRHQEAQCVAVHATA